MIEKTPFKSKKFIAFFFTITVLVGFGITALVTQVIGWPLAAFMLAIILTIGTIAVGYILGQAGLEKYEKIAIIPTKVQGLFDGNKKDDQVE